MQRSQRTKAPFTRLCQVGAVLLFVPILMAVGCPLTVTVSCPTTGTAGTAVNTAVTVSGGQGTATWTTAVTGGTVANGTTDAPSVTPGAGGGTVTVTVTATDTSGATATGMCSFDATASACQNDAGCDDGVFCNGAETCANIDATTGNGTCAAGTAPCTGANQTCNETTDACDTACTADADCDDNSMCTTDTCTNGTCVNAAVDCNDNDACTVDTCVAATGCANTPVTCAAGQQCVNGVCVTTCTAAADCDDNDPCTDDACANGACTNTAKACDNGNFCDGVETCNAGTGACDSAGDPCAAGTTCNETTDTCDMQTACANDGDCNDGLFCNGTETCANIDATTMMGTCAAGTAPCAADQTCDDTADSCANPAGQTFTLTLAQDSGPAFTGGSGDDTFNAPLTFNAPTGTTIPSLQTGDSLAGALGNDTMTATFNFAGATTVSPTMSAIETFNVTDFGSGASTTIAGATITGVTDINISSSTNTNPLLFTGLATLPNVSLTNQAIGATIGMTAAATAGAADAVTVALSNVTGGTLTYTEGNTNGIETLNITSSGGANRLADVAMTNGTTLTTVNVSGDQRLTLTASLDANVTTVNASTSTGGSVLTQTNPGNLTYTGGTGNDTIILGVNYGGTDTLDGGAGTDTLGGTTAALGGTIANQANVSNFEALRISDAHTTVLNTSHFGTISGVTLDVGSNNGSVTNAAAGINVSMGTRAGTSAGGGTFALTLTGTGTSDACTLTLNDAEQAGNVTFTGCETLNLISNLDLDGSAADTGTAGQNTLAGTLVLTDTAVPEKVVITGTEQMNITGAITANEIDASGMTEPFVMGAAPATAGIPVKGGGGADTLRGSAGNDIIDGNAGNDQIRPGAGVDIVNAGAGADMLLTDSMGLAGVDRNSVSDFDDTPTSGDQVAINIATTAVTLSGTDDFATAASIQTHTTAGNLVVNAAAEVVVVRSATVADFTTANSLNGTNLLTAIGGTITVAANGNMHLYAVANVAGDVGVYWGNPGAADTGVVAAELTLVAVLQGGAVDIANLVFQNFANPNIP